MEMLQMDAQLKLGPEARLGQIFLWEGNFPLHTAYHELQA
jgi:hypothetical protein